MIKRKFFFVRHGRTDWNEKHLCQGQIDVPLNQLGKDEIEKLCPLISGLTFSKIVTSPLSRALESAKIIEQHVCRPLEILDLIKERGWGNLEGATSDDMYAIERQEEINKDFVAGNNIEGRSRFQSRIILGLNSVLDEGTPLIVSHGRVFLVLTEILGLPLVRQIPNATVMECLPASNGWKIISHSIKERHEIRKQCHET